MKKLFKNPVFIIGGSLILLIALVLYFSANASAQEKPKPDSIQVYQIIALPQGIDAAIKIISGKFMPKDKSGTYADSVLFGSIIDNLNIRNGKMIKIVNPDKAVEPKKLISPKK